MAQHPAMQQYSPRYLDNGFLDVSSTGDFIAIAERNATESPLLQLPADIRNRIFQFALAGEIIRPKPSDAHLAAWNKLDASIYRAPLHRFSLLRTCRQVYSETAILPFTLSTFTFFKDSSINRWLLSLTYRERNMVRNIRNLQIGVAFLECRFKKLSNLLLSSMRLTNLEWIDIRIYSYGENPSSTRSNCDPFLEYFKNTAAVVTYGDSVPYKEWLKEWVTSSEVDRKSLVCSRDSWMTWAQFLGDESA